MKENIIKLIEELSKEVELTKKDRDMFSNSSYTYHFFEGRISQLLCDIDKLQRLV